MYIAFNWLVGMVLTMWVLLCSFDIYWKKNMKTHFEYDLQKLLPAIYQNTSLRQENIQTRDKTKITFDNLYRNIYFQFLLCFAGVCMILILIRKENIVMIIKRKLNYTNFDTIDAYLYLRIKILCLKETAKEIRDTILRLLKKIYLRLKVNQSRDINVNVILPNKLKELNREQSSDTLIPAIQENKKLRMQSKLKTVCNYENTVCNFNVHLQKPIRENMTLNVGLQQLYLLTHQENVFLKSKLKCITKEKEDAERKLIKLINRVCQTKNNDLKAYCSQFIVQTKNNLLNSDVKAEIQKFLKTTSDNKFYPVHKIFSEQSIPKRNSLKQTDLIDSETEQTLALKKDTPKCKVSDTQILNYVWTVKDKDGMIEKLYEYDNDFRNGDTIRRIRQYSVYYDTERFVDFSNSTGRTNIPKADVSSNLVSATNHRFLTGSQAFKNFLQNNKSIAMKSSRTPNSTICIAT